MYSLKHGLLSFYLLGTLLLTACGVSAGNSPNNLPSPSYQPSPTAKATQQPDKSKYDVQNPIDWCQLPLEELHKQDEITPDGINGVVNQERGYIIRFYNCLKDSSPGKYDAKTVSHYVSYENTDGSLMIITGRPYVLSLSRDYLEAIPSFKQILEFGELEDGYVIVKDPDGIWGDGDEEVTNGDSSHRLSLLGDPTQTSSIPNTPTSNPLGCCYLKVENITNGREVLIRFGNSNDYTDAIQGNIGRGYSCPSVPEDVAAVMTIGTFLSFSLDDATSIVAGEPNYWSFSIKHLKTIPSLSSILELGDPDSDDYINVLDPDRVLGNGDEILDEQAPGRNPESTSAPSLNITPTPKSQQPIRYCSSLIDPLCGVAYSNTSGHN